MKFEHRLGARILAYIVDAIAIGIIGRIFLLIGLGEEVTYWGYTTVQLAYWENALSIGLYFVGFAYLNKGITLGKMLFKLEVRSGNTEELERNKIVVREIVKTLTMPISFISFLLCAFREDHKTIHDMLSDTITLKVIDPNQKEYNPSNFKSNNQYNQPIGANEPQNNNSDYYDDPAEKTYEDPLKNTNSKDDDYYY